MLKKNKSISLSGESKVDGQVVARFNATVSSDNSEDSNSNSFNTYIYNRELYDANRREVRKDMSDFRQYVFDQEDELFTDSSANQTDVTSTE